MRLTSLNQLIRKRETIDGFWHLGNNHELEYKRRGPNEEVVLSGPLIAAESDALVFRVVEKSDAGVTTSRLFQLKGRWEADGRNRLTFLASRGSGRVDRLTFEAGWELDENQQILCRWQEGALTFQGQWQIDRRRQLVYLLDLEQNSGFRFRGAFQSPSVQAKQGEIRYQLGVEVEGKRRVQIVTLFGKWKVSRDLALEFEIVPPAGRKYSLSFGASYAVTSSGSISAHLTVREGDPIGLEVLFTQDFLKGDGEGFLRLRKSLEETAVEAGLRLKW